MVASAPRPFTLIPYAGTPRSAMGTPVQVFMQLDQVRAALRMLDRLHADAEHSEREYVLLESVSRGLYEELEKLCRWDPNASVSLLELDEVNCVIEEAYPLLQSDRFINHFLRPFDPGGGLPPLREVVLALCELRLGLERYMERLLSRLEALDSLLEEAEAIRGALEIAVLRKRRNIHENGAVLCGDLRQRGCEGHPDWFRNYSYNLSDFDFARLNQTDILAYFLAEILGDFFTDYLAKL